MAINNRPVQEVIDGMTLATSTEAQFVTAATNLIRQVEENTDDIEVERTIGVTGDVAGSSTFHLDAPEDSDIDIVLNLTTDAITTDNITDANVTTAKIADNAVVNSKIADDAVNTAEIINDAVTTPKILNDAVTHDKLAANSVDSEQIRLNAVENQHITAATIQNDRLANRNITLTNFGTGRDVAIDLGATGTVPTFSGTNNGLAPGYNGTELRSTSDRAVLASDGNWYTVESWALSTSETIPATRVATTGTARSATYEADSDYSGNTYANTAAGARDFVREADNRTFPLARNDSVSVTESASGTVYVFNYIGNGVNAATDAAAADLVSLGSVDAYTAGTGLALVNNQFSIADGGVNTTQIANNSVTNDKLADNSVNTVDIVDTAVTTAKIADDAVTTAKIADDAITNALMADNAINTAEIMNDAVTEAKMAFTDSDGISGQLLSSNGDGTFSWLDGGNVIGDAIVSKYNITTVANQTVYTVPDNGAIATSNLVYIDGVILHDSEDYSFSADGRTLTIASAVAAGKDIQIASWANANALSTGQVAGTAIAAGGIGSDQLANGAVVNAKLGDGSVGDRVLNDITLNLGANGWDILIDSSNRLTFQYNGNTVVRFDTNGHIHAENDITAFDSI